MKYTIFNQQLIDENAVCISPSDRGFRYGDGLFETLIVESGKIYQLPFHLKRLSAGISAIKIAFDTQILPALCQQLITANNLQNGLLRIQITRGVGGRGYLPEVIALPLSSPTSSGVVSCTKAYTSPSLPSMEKNGKHYSAKATLLIETIDAQQAGQKPVKLWQSSYQKISAKSLPVNYKLCQGLNSTLARIEAVENNCFDAILLNENNHICETSSANIFWLKKGELYTPAIDCGVLEGSIRNAIFRLSPYKINEVRETIDTLKTAEAVFITNVAWRVLEVCEIQQLNIKFNSNQLAKELLNMLNRDISQSM